MPTDKEQLPEKPGTSQKEQAKFRRDSSNSSSGASGSEKKQLSANEGKDKTGTEKRLQELLKPRTGAESSRDEGKKPAFIRKVTDKSGAERSSGQSSQQGQGSNKSSSGGTGGSDNNKENLHPRNKKNMLLTAEQFQEKFLETKNKRGPPKGKKDILAKLVSAQVKKDEKAREGRAARKAAALEKKNEVATIPEEHYRHLVVHHPVEPHVEFHLTKEYEKQKRGSGQHPQQHQEENQIRRNTTSSSSSLPKTPVKKNQIAPFPPDIPAPPIVPKTVEQVSSSPEAANNEDANIKTLVGPRLFNFKDDISDEPPPPPKKRDLTPQKLVTSKGQRLLLHQLPDFSGVFNVERLDKNNKEDEDDDEETKRNMNNKTLTSATHISLRRESNKEKQDYQKLLDFNIPIEPKMMKSLLETDFHAHNFNGLIRQYYSHVLRSYCLMNMQERYRGLSNNAPCLSLIDISKLQPKDLEHNKRREKAIQNQAANLENLRAAATDSLHYKFLKEITLNQPLTTPISIMQTILAETTPVVENVWKYYSSQLGKKHECSRKAGLAFLRLERRRDMYDKLLGEGIVTLE